MLPSLVSIWWIPATCLLTFLGTTILISLLTMASREDRRAEVYPLRPPLPPA